MDDNDDNAQFLHGLKAVVSSGKKMNPILSCVASEGARLTVPVVSPGHRKHVVDVMKKMDITLHGKEDLIDDLIEKSTNDYELRFKFLGLDVSMHLFLDINRGAILVDGFVFERFTLNPETILAWPVFLVETLLVVVNTGIFNHLGPGTINEHVIEEMIPVNAGDVILRMEPTPLMLSNHRIVKHVSSRPVVFDTGKMIDDWTGTIPIIVSRDGFENKNARKVRLTPGMLADLVNDINEKRLKNDEEDQYMLNAETVDDFLRRIAGN
jgi:hypothetical protein